MEKPLELPDFLPITSDYGFKVTFGNRTNTLFLRRALQALIQSAVPIVEVEFPKNTQEGETYQGRAGIYDLICRDENGQVFLVEMQKGHYPGFVQRLRFYGNHQFNLLANRGESSFENLPKIYCIGILGFDLFPMEHYHTNACLRDDNGRVIDNQTEYIFVELGKFRKKGEDCTTDLDKLIYAMRNGHISRPSIAHPDFMNEDWIRAALEEINTRKMDPEEYALAMMSWAREASEYHAEKKRIQAAEEKAAAIGEKRGEKRGERRGERRGEKRGERRGEKRGEKRGEIRGEIIGIEKEKTKNIRRILLAVDWDDTKIADLFETTPEAVAKIRAALKT